MSCFGRDLDEVFAYQTPKVVVLKDRTLGIVRYSLTLAIVLYIFVFTMLFQGKHLSVADVDGVFRVQLQHPTMNMCNPEQVDCEANFTQYGKLPYCAESTLPYRSDEKGTPQKKLQCQLWDQFEATKKVEDGVMVPTRIRRYEQRRGCTPSKSNDWSCTGRPYVSLDSDGNPQKGKHDATPKYDAFVADVEKFTMLIDHAFQRQNGMGFDDHELNGYVYDCPPQDGNGRTGACKAVPIECVHGECPKGAVTPSTSNLLALRGAGVAFHNHGQSVATDVPLNAVALDEQDVSVSHQLESPHMPSEWQEGTANMVSHLKKGDVFQLGDLLQRAHTSLDGEGGNISDVAQRSRGMVVVIHIQYDNRYPSSLLYPPSWLGVSVNPWTTPKPFYTYKITTRPSYDYKLIEVSGDPSDVTRRVRVYNGIRFVVEQSGKIAMFQLTDFLITFTSALGLMAVAATLTDLMMLNIMPRRDAYKSRKFYESQDFNPEPGDAKKTGPLSSQDAGNMLIEAIEAQDGKAVAEALPKLLTATAKAN